MQIQIQIITSFVNQARSAAVSLMAPWGIILILSPSTRFHFHPNFHNSYHMDLPYPSHKEIPHDNNPLSAMKRFKSTMWSSKDLAKNEPALSGRAKSALLQLIQKDSVKELANKIKKFKILPTIEVGSNSSSWSLLHFCARWNSTECMEYILKDAYASSYEYLFSMVNAKTCEGYTPLMVSVIYTSNHSLKAMLEIGAVDIFLVDNNRTTAYQMAISARNDFAITNLMEYQRINKMSTFVNTERLQEPYKFPTEDKECAMCQWWRSVKDWVFRIPRNKEIIDAYSDQETSRRTSETVRHPGCFYDPEFSPSSRSISKMTDEVREYVVEWIRIENLHDSERGTRLFESYQPLEISQSNFTLRHNLIILQSLCRNPILVRRIIYKDQEVDGCYRAYLFPKGVCQEVAIDDFIPCLKDRKEAMFISCSNECWPMLLQKAWVKTYGSYVEASNIHPRVILHQMTGFITETYQLRDFEHNLFATLKKYFGIGFISVLQSRHEEDVGCESFTILNFYDKGSKRMYLVNCPSMISRWKENEKCDSFGMKLIKAHFNNMNQLSVWMDSETLLSRFESISVCHVMADLERTSLLIQCRGCLFFKFSIPLESSHSTGGDNNLKYLLKAYEYRKDEPTFYEEVPFGDISVALDEGIDDSLVGTYQHSDRVMQISVVAGEYFCKVQLADNTPKSINLVVFGKDKLTIQVLDEEIGKVEWLSLLRDRAITQPMTEVNNHIRKREILFLDYLLIVSHHLSNTQATVRVSHNEELIDYCIQGHLESQNVVALQPLKDGFCFATLKLKSGKRIDDLQLEYSSS